MIKDGKPSAIKRRRHGAMEVGMLVISHANVPAYAVANGAAEIKRPTRRASSSRL